jgi:hypothetical protein
MKTIVTEDQAAVWATEKMVSEIKKIAWFKQTIV